jgi:hypothetical protein
MKFGSKVGIVYRNEKIIIKFYDNSKFLLQNFITFLNGRENEVPGQRHPYPL